jgi:hypothetical protein
VEELGLLVEDKFTAELGAEVNDLQVHGLVINCGLCLQELN